MAFEEEKPSVSGDSFYVYHLVHALGYLPSIELRRYLSESRVDIETAKEELALMMALYEDPTGKMSERIACYVGEKAVGDKFGRVGRSEEGSVLWSVTEGRAMDAGPEEK